MYGKDKAKISLDAKASKQGNLILVTAINPTPAGEGKTTITVGLGDALKNVLGNLHGKVAIALREPSLGPVFGRKGGATGGGKSIVIPEDDINLHFTGDMHAITSANNLLAAMIDNHIFHGNQLQIDEVTWKRCIDMNDRTLRGTFEITAASEVMAIFCLAKDEEDLKERLGNIVVGYSKSKPIFARDLKANGAMAKLLENAIKPNLVQTAAGTPVFMHGGPFANIAHGCNSLIATNMARSLADYVVTEAGFGADLGAEKFIHIKKQKPNAIVIVATVRALKYNGGVAVADLDTPDVDALKRGLPNLEKHIENMKSFGVPVCVAINSFKSDTFAEYQAIKQLCKDKGVKASVTNSFEQGQFGATELAWWLITELRHSQTFIDDYPSVGQLRRIEHIVEKFYGGDGVDMSDETYTKIQNMFKQFDPDWLDSLPICMAKNPYSFTDDPTQLGRPSGFTIKVSDVKLCAGAGFIVAYTGDVMTMPGLPKVPSAEKFQ
jgi:formate--tetrahydrofolate ligase